MLGDEPAPQAFEGPSINEAIALRWTGVLKNGLDEDVKKDLLSKHLPPKNFGSLNVPKLNPEIKAALPAQSINRDGRLISKQEILVGGIAVIANTLSEIIDDNNRRNSKYVACLGDAGRLLCHLQHSESTTRRELITLNLNKDLRETLSDAPIDDLLFGSTLEERVKAAKNLEKSSKELKLTKPNISKKVPSGPLNSRRPTLVQKGARVGQFAGKNPYPRPYYQGDQARQMRNQSHQPRRRSGPHHRQPPKGQQTT